MVSLGNTFVIQSFLIMTSQISKLTGLILDNVKGNYLSSFKIYLVEMIISRLPR